MITKNEIEALNRLVKDIEEREAYNRAVEAAQKKLWDLKNNGTEVYMYAITCHTLAREWGEHFFEIEGLFFSFENALTELKSIREDRRGGCSAEIKIEDESASWEHTDYDGYYQYAIVKAQVQ